MNYKGDDFTDIHHLRPSDWNVNSVRSNLYFGSCGLVEPMSACQSPADSEAADDTARDGSVFQPPANARGAIARAIFYMDLRYSNQNKDGMDLVVTDCPNLEDPQPNEMAYKSQLLEWHSANPVTDAERQRNQRACERWQGNRNVFVDYPDLVAKFYGSPQTPMGEGLGYPGCDTGSSISASTAAPGAAAGQCDDLSAGDIMIVRVTSDYPETAAFVAFQDLSEGLFLYMTDNAWMGSSFRNNEGTLSFRVPLGGIAAGTVFGYDTSAKLLYSQEWETESGQFNLATAGDTVILYCETGDKSIRFLTALDFSGSGWMQSSLDEHDYGTGTSALPEGLARYSLSLPLFDNSLYIGATEGSRSELQASLSDPNAWDGNNGGSDTTTPPESFVISSSSSSEESPVQSPLSPGDIMVIAVNSANPDLVAMVALKNIPANTPIYMTDNAWTGRGFRTNEGVMRLSVPSSGIDAGTIFGYGSDLLYGTDWESVGGRFALAESGDNVMIYTASDTNIEEIVHLGAFTNAGVDGWKVPGLEDSEYDTYESALPEELSSVGATSLAHQDNYLYTGPVSGDKATIQFAIQNAANWEGSNSDPVSVPTAPFSVRLGSLGTTPSSATRSALYDGSAVCFITFTIIAKLLT